MARSQVKIVTKKVAKIALRPFLVLTLLIFPGNSYYNYASSADAFLTIRGLIGYRSSSDVNLIDAAKDSIIKTAKQSVEIDLIRQILRIMEQHYVQKERLDPFRILSAGILKLRKEFSIDIQLARDITPFLVQGQGRILVRLCSDIKKERVEFCETTDQSRDVKVNRRIIDQLYLDKSKNTLEIPALRVGSEVFFSSVSPESGLRFVEFLSRALFLKLLEDTGISHAQLLHVFLNGMLDELDPHSGFLSEDEYRELRGGTRGQFGGIGVVIDESAQLPVIREIIPNSPAYVAGIRQGDVLLKVGRKIVAFEELDLVLKNIREIVSGYQTPVWFYRPKSRRVLRVFLTKEEIPTRSVTQRAVRGRSDVLFLKLSGFSAKTSEELLSTYQDAMEISHGRYRSLVLDLRGNPGGLLDQAIQVADLFINDGVIVTTKSRHEEQSEYATKGSKITLPTLVLINSSSASASEIVAGALKDHKRAVIVGERSFGKGSVQSLFELSGNTALKLTIAHYFTPSGFSLQSLGVTPHVGVNLIQLRDKALWMAGSSEAEREEALALHLDNPDVNGALGKLEAPETIWAIAQVNSHQPNDLEELNFSYPSLDSVEQNVLLGEDSVARVGISLMDSLFQAKKDMSKISLSEIVSQIPKVRSAEAGVIRSSLDSNYVRDNPEVAKLIDNLFLFQEKSKNSSIKQNVFGKIKLLDAVKPKFPAIDKLIVSTRFAESGAKVCCFFNDYQFKFVMPEKQNIGKKIGKFSLSAKNLTQLGMVGMRLESNTEGGVAWVPAFLHQDKFGNILGSFMMPPVFRAYVTLNHQTGNQASFFYKEDMYSDPILIGMLPVESPKINNHTNAVPMPIETILVHSDNNSGVAIGVNFALKNLERNRKYELLVVSMADDRAKILQQVVPLRKNISGNLYGEIKVKWSDAASMTRGLGFGGVIGGILRTTGGEVVSKWPIAYLDDYGLRSSSLNGELVKYSETSGDFIQK